MDGARGVSRRGSPGPRPALRSDGLCRCESHHAILFSLARLHFDSRATTGYSPSETRFKAIPGPLVRAHPGRSTVSTGLYPAVALARCRFRGLSWNGTGCSAYPVAGLNLARREAVGPAKPAATLEPQGCGEEACHG